MMKFQKREIMSQKKSPVEEYNGQGEEAQEDDIVESPAVVQPPKRPNIAYKGCGSAALHTPHVAI